MRFHVLRGHRSNFLNYDVFMSLKNVFNLANSAYPDEMPHFAACHLGFHCQSTCLQASRMKMVNYNSLGSHEPWAQGELL